MSAEYWLRDAENRVLGPIGLEVIRELLSRGKLGDVRAVSKDGKTYLPVAEIPEIASALSPQAEDAARAQASATKQIRDWLALVKDRATHEVLRIDAKASKEAARAAFFSLVQRYVPSRLPPDATPELRLACEDAFIFLSGRIVDLERGPAQAPRTLETPAPSVSWRGGMMQVLLTLPRGDASPFTMEPTASWRDDCLTVPCAERVMVGTPANVTLSFEGHVKQIVSSGRVVGVRTIAPLGFSVKLLDLNEELRSMIRTWVIRADR